MENRKPSKMRKSKSSSKVPRVQLSSCTIATQQQMKKQPVKSKSTSALPKNMPKFKDQANYKVVSKSSLLQDFKTSAVNGLATVKNRFNSFSALLKQSKKSKSDLENYCPISEQPTPVKLYSPFTIESPMPKIVMDDKLRFRQQLFASPANKFKEDVAGLENGLDELHILSRRIQVNFTQAVEQKQEHQPNIMPPSASSSVAARLWFDDFSLI